MKGFIFFLISFLGLVTSQKLFKAKFSDCGKIINVKMLSWLHMMSLGSLLKIAPALEGSVKMSSPYGWKIGRHILQPVKIPNKKYFHHYMIDLHLGKDGQNLYQWNSPTWFCTSSCHRSWTEELGSWKGE